MFNPAKINMPLFLFFVYINEICYSMFTNNTTSTSAL